MFKFTMIYIYWWVMINFHKWLYFLNQVASLSQNLIFLCCGDLLMGDFLFLPMHFYLILDLMQNQTETWLLKWLWNCIFNVPYDIVDICFIFCIFFVFQTDKVSDTVLEGHVAEVVYQKAIEAIPGICSCHTYPTNSYSTLQRWQNSH